MKSFHFLLTTCILGSIFATADTGVNSTLSLLRDGFKEVDITADDGITLKSIVFNPTPTSSNGKNPVVVFISSWGLNKWEYVVPANQYADKGYTVVSYTARGFWQSGGYIDMAGPNDMADVSTVIDWALANTHADPDRIGLSGISYGGGISVLATAHDSRIKSIAAMSCWVDLAESFLGYGETIKMEAAAMLKAAAELLGNPSEDLEAVFYDYFHNEDLQFLYDYTYNSSGVNFIDAINANNPAVFIANALGDSLFNPNQFPAFYNSLTTPKHIEFAPGDHAGPEMLGLFGLPDQVWDRAGEWNDYYLLNNQDGTFESMPAVVFNTMNGDEIESYDSWSDVTNEYMTFEMATNEHLTIGDITTGLITTSEETLVSFETGDDANINGGVAYLSWTVRAYIDVQRRFGMDHISRKHGAVFISEKLDYDYRLRGAPVLNLNIIPAETDGTLVIYLLDVDELNVGHLFNFSPWTFKGVTPGELLSIQYDMNMISYDLPAGRRLGVVVGSHDPLFKDQNTEDATIQIVGGSYVRMPIHA